MLRFVRHLQVASRTTTNPNQFKLLTPCFTPKSAIIFTTPQNIRDVVAQLERALKTGVTVVVAAIDTVPGNHRDGVSELWLDESITINGYKYLDQHTHSHNGEPCLGHGHANQYQWEKPNGSITLNMGSVSTKVSLANTLFATQFANTMFFVELGNHASGQTLAELSVSVPMNPTLVEVEDHWEPLFEGKQMQITSVTGNLLKKVDGNLCAGLLQSNDRLMSSGKELEVYVKITPKDGSATMRFKCIASGGSWGPKKDIVALDPDAQPKKGDLIQFYMLHGSSRNTKSRTPVNGVIFECSLEEVNYQAGGGEPQAFDGVFGAGAEAGVIINGIRHTSCGETVLLSTV